MRSASAQLLRMPTPPTPPGPDGIKRHYTAAEVTFTPGIEYLDALVARLKAEKARLNLDAPTDQ
jgi:hypothetical protein